MIFTKPLFQLAKNVRIFFFGFVGDATQVPGQLSHVNM